jgi:hypothetical protein
MHYFTRNALEAAMGSVVRSDKDPAYTIPASTGLIYFPFPESATTPAYPALGVFWKLTNGKKQHVVGFCRRLDMSTTW